MIKYTVFIPLTGLFGRNLKLADNVEIINYEYATVPVVIDFDYASPIGSATFKKVGQFLKVQLEVMKIPDNTELSFGGQVMSRRDDLVTAFSPKVISYVPEIKR